MAEKKTSAEATVKNIRQKGRKKCSTEKKIRIELSVLAFYLPAQSAY